MRRNRQSVGIDPPPGLVLFLFSCFDRGMDELLPMDEPDVLDALASSLQERSAPELSFGPPPLDPWPSVRRLIHSSRYRVRRSASYGLSRSTQSATGASTERLNARIFDRSKGWPALVPAYPTMALNSELSEGNSGYWKRAHSGRASTASSIFLRRRRWSASS